MPDFSPLSVRDTWPTTTTTLNLDFFRRCGPQPGRFGGVGLCEKDWTMNITYKHSARILMSLALVNGSLCFQAACRGAEGAPTNQAERTGTSGGQELGLLAIDHARSFSSNVLAEATTSGLMVMSISKVISRTNAFFAESRQNLALEAAEPQL